MAIFTSGSSRFWGGGIFVGVKTAKRLNFLCKSSQDSWAAISITMVWVLLWGGTFYTRCETFAWTIKMYGENLLIENTRIDRCDFNVVLDT